AAGRALAGLAHVQRAALQILAIELGDRLLRLARRAHLDEAEAARLPGGAIGDDRDRLARPGLREQRLQVLARGVEGKVADEDLLAHFFSRSSPLMGRLWILSRLPGREADVGYAAGSRTNKRTRLVYHRSPVSCKRVPPGAGSGRARDGRQPGEHPHVRRPFGPRVPGREVVVVA